MTTRFARARTLEVATCFALLAAPLAIGACGDDASPSGPRASDWAGYGRDDENTRNNSAETLISTANVASLVERWRFSEAAVTSTPTVYDGTVYFGDWNAALHAVDAKSGQERWRYQVQPMGGTNQINSSILVTEDTVYAGAQGALVSAVDRKSGKLKWSSVIDNQKSLMLWSSPVLVDETIIIGVGSFQVFIPMNPPFKGSVIGLNAKDGSVKWQTFLTVGDGSGVSVWSSAAIDKTRKLAIIGTGQQYTVGADTPHSDALVALDYETGAIKWSTQFTMGDRFQSGQDPQGPDHDVGAAPNLFELNGVAYAGVGDKAGRYFVVNRDTGAIVWKKELTPGGANGGIMASTAYSNGVIFVASNDGTTGGTAGVGGGPGACTVFALNAADGSIKWQVPSKPGVFGALSTANGVLYVPSLSGELRGYDVNTGNLLWTGNTGMTMGGGISISDGMVYAGFGWTWVPLLQTPGGLIAYGLPQ